jgi:hypothetical protein
MFDVLLILVQILQSFNVYRASSAESWPTFVQGRRRYKILENVKLM